MTTLLALEALTRARLQGAKPAVVFVTLGPCQQSPWWSDGTAVEIVVPAEIEVLRLDFRPLVGCEVIVLAQHRDARLRQVTARICSQAARVTVLAGTDPDDLGHVWERGAGWRKFGRAA